MEISRKCVTYTYPKLNHIVNTGENQHHYDELEFWKGMEWEEESIREEQQRRFEAINDHGHGTFRYQDQDDPSPELHPPNVIRDLVG